MLDEGKTLSISYASPHPKRVVVIQDLFLEEYDFRNIGESSEMKKSNKLSFFVDLDTWHILHRRRDITFGTMGHMEIVKATIFQCTKVFTKGLHSMFWTRRIFIKVIICPPWSNTPKA